MVALYFLLIEFFVNFELFEDDTLRGTRKYERWCAFKFWNIDKIIHKNIYCCEVWIERIGSLK